MPDPAFQNNPPATQRRASATAGPATESSLPPCSDFESFVNRQLSLCRRRRMSMAVLSIAIQGIDSVEHQHGQAVAQQLLLAAWSRLKNNLRTSDLIARIDGSTFAAVLLGASESTAVCVQKRLAQVLAQAYSIGPLELALRAVPGFAVYPKTGPSAAALIAAATQSRTIKAAMA